MVDKPDKADEAEANESNKAKANEANKAKVANETVKADDAAADLPTDNKRA